LSFAQLPIGHANIVSHNVDIPYVGHVMFVFRHAGQVLVKCACALRWFLVLFFEFYACERVVRELERTCSDPMLLRGKASPIFSHDQPFLSFKSTNFSSSFIVNRGRLLRDSSADRVALARVVFDGGSPPILSHHFASIVLGVVPRI
jgi:hypothetical protein